MVKRLAKGIAALSIFVVVYVLVRIVAALVMYFSRDLHGWILYPQTICIVIVASIFGVVFAGEVVERIFGDYPSRTIGGIFIGVMGLLIAFGVAAQVIDPQPRMFFNIVVPIVGNVAAIAATIYSFFIEREA